MKKESAICKKQSLTGNFPLTALTIKQVTEITLLSHIESKQLMQNVQCLWRQHVLFLFPLYVIIFMLVSRHLSKTTISGRWSLLIMQNRQLNISVYLCIILPFVPNLESMWNLWGIFTHHFLLQNVKSPFIPSGKLLLPDLKSCPHRNYFSYLV